MTYFVHRTGDLPSMTWAGIKAFADELAQFCEITTGPGRAITVPLIRGEITLEAGGAGATVHLRAASAETMQTVHDTLAFTLDKVGPGLSDQLRWHGDSVSEGSPPPNFRIARLRHCEQITPKFIRLRLEADDLGFMAGDGLHFRLLQPRDPENPVWPRLSASGRTVWPEGGQLHMPVYTMRRLDAAAGWLDVDVFVHGNGPTCGWALQARSGDIVGISGPGGGGLPEERDLLLGGDETALPVIARILQDAAPETRGRAIIEVSSPDEIQSLEYPEAVGLQWLIRGRDLPLQTVFHSDMIAVLETGYAASPQPHIFFGGEKADAQALRKKLRPRFARLPENIRIAAYWTRDNGQEPQGRR